MPRADLAQISREIDPRPAFRSTSISESISENLLSMWAQSDAMTLRGMEQKILQDVRTSYTQTTGRVPAPIPAFGEEFVTEDKQVRPLTEKNWLFDQIAKLSPEDQGAVGTPEVVEQRLIAARDQVLRETGARIEEATTTGKVVGALVGGAIAGLTDPFTLPFLPFGGFARVGLSTGAAMLRVGAIEAAIGGVTAIPGELINASMEERSGRKASIERAATNIGLAALGGFAFGGLIEGGIRVGRRVFNNYRIRDIETEVVALRGIEREADAIGVAMKRAGIEMPILVERRAAIKAMEEAIEAFRNNDVPKARAAIATGHKTLGETPDNFVARIKAISDDPQMQKLIVEAEEAGQAAKRAVAKAEGATPEGPSPTQPALTPEGPKRIVTPETEVVNSAFKAQKRTAERFRELNDRLPEGVTIVRRKGVKDAYDVRTAREGQPVQLKKIGNAKSAKSVAATLRSVKAYERAIAPQAERELQVAVGEAERVNSLDAREAESATYQGIELEERVDAAQQTLDRRFEGREDEKVFMEMDAEGNVVARSLNDLKAADAKDDFLANEFKGCVTGVNT